jgi:hypothetical protein
VDFFQKGGRIANEEDGANERRGAEVEWRYDGTVTESRSLEVERERREREGRERSQTEQGTCTVLWKDLNCFQICFSSYACIATFLSKSIM